MEKRSASGKPEARSFYLGLIGNLRAKETLASNLWRFATLAHLTQQQDWHQICEIHTSNLSMRQGATNLRRAPRAKEKAGQVWMFKR